MEKITTYKYILKPETEYQRKLKELQEYSHIGRYEKIMKHKFSQYQIDSTIISKFLIIKDYNINIK